LSNNVTNIPRKPGAPALKFFTLGDLLADQSPAPEPLLVPWLKQGESGMVYAAPASGKSMFTMGLALAIAGGGSFLGWSIPKPRKVLLVDGEMPKHEIKERARMLLPAAEGCDVEEAGRNLEVLAKQAQNFNASFPDLGDTKGQEEVLRVALAHKADLVILDNLSTLATTQDENSAAASQHIVKLLMRMKQAGIACILVHHANKAGESFRGSSMLATTFEVIMGLKRPDAPQPFNVLAFQIEWDKYRGKRNETTQTRDIRLDTGKDGAPAKWYFETSEVEHLRKLVAAVKSRKYATQKDLAEALDVVPGTVSKWKRAAILDLKLITDTEWEAHMDAAKEIASGRDDEDAEERNPPF
jgi:KaiC/GvpD/RAD55 family RecA-like ATPase